MTPPIPTPSHSSFSTRIRIAALAITYTGIALVLLEQVAAGPESRLFALGAALAEAEATRRLFQEKTARLVAVQGKLAVLLGKKLRVRVATLSQIADLLKKTEQSQRVLEEVTEGFALDVVGEWWTLLIVHSVMDGCTRFDAIQSRLGIARNILIDRLNTLVTAGVQHRRQRG